MHRQGILKMKRFISVLILIFIAFILYLFPLTTPEQLHLLMILYQMTVIIGRGETTIPQGMTGGDIDSDDRYEREHDREDVDRDEHDRDRDWLMATTIGTVEREKATVKVTEMIKTTMAQWRKDPTMTNSVKGRSD